MSNGEYKQDDPRLRPVPLDAYAWTPLPSPPTPDAIVKVSLIPTSKLVAPLRLFTPSANDDETEEAPSRSFLIEKGDEAILFDMGLRADPEHNPRKIVEGPLKQFKPLPGRGPIERLQGHEYDLSRLKLVVLSHQHFDLMQPFWPHVYLSYQHHSLSGNLDTLPSPAPPILLGPHSLESIGSGYPADPNAAWPQSWLDKYRFVELPGAEAEGAWAGEIARVRLGASHGGDASHSQDLYLPVPTSREHDLRLPLPVIDGQPQLAVDPALATHTIGQLTRMSAEENVMVLLAHEGEAGGVVDVYPGDLGQWKAKGWKEAKERGVNDRVEARRRGRA
ncbi:hypothetical protein JCM24511_09683 [Saitozyma sp. JCM 24511]|nr:hypothetical protein JCM24511_09683 [Saitozyma sp. JCM 24511]